jgi:ornithine cyclodeaminase/alanine dehydrogenase-like protein (mu-crystallin family)
VESADEGATEDFALDQRVASMRASILERVDLALDVEDGDRPVPSLEKDPALGRELVEGSLEPVLGRARHRPRLDVVLPLYLRESEVEQLLTPLDAIAAVEACFERIARGAIENRLRFRLGLDDGLLHVMAATDRELGVAGLKTYVTLADGARAVVVLFASDRPETLAIIEAGELGRLRTGAASAVAASHLARSDVRTLGVLGAGRQAETQIACLRAALPGIAEVVVFARRRDRLEAFCEQMGASPAGYNRDAAEQDVVVTATTSRDPVLRGEWLRPGAFVVAMGANRIEARELDNTVLERAAFICCDSSAQARLEAGDLVEPVERGILDWLEVHELAEVVSGEISGRQSTDDIVLFKSLGIAAEDLAVGKLVYDRAREQGLGVEL